ncbi:RecF/RecN/SMC N terminal domain-containing protein, partial [Toxoplasma gondii CAST]
MEAPNTAEKTRGDSSLAFPLATAKLPSHRNRRRADQQAAVPRDEPPASPASTASFYSVESDSACGENISSETSPAMEGVPSLALEALSSDLESPSPPLRKRRFVGSSQSNSTLGAAPSSLPRKQLTHSREVRHLHASTQASRRQRDTSLPSTDAKLDSLPSSSPSSHSPSSPSSASSSCDYSTAGSREASGQMAENSESAGSCASGAHAPAEGGEREPRGSQRRLPVNGRRSLHSPAAAHASPRSGTSSGCPSSRSAGGLRDLIRRAPDLFREKAERLSSGSETADERRTEAKFPKSTGRMQCRKSRREVASSSSNLRSLARDRGSGTEGGSGEGTRRRALSIQGLLAMTHPQLAVKLETKGVQRRGRPQGAAPASDDEVIVIPSSSDSSPRSPTRQDPVELERHSDVLKRGEGKQRAEKPVSSKKRHNEGFEAVILSDSDDEGQNTPQSPSSSSSSLLFSSSSASSSSSGAPNCAAAVEADCEALGPPVGWRSAGNHPRSRAREGRRGDSTPSPERRRASLSSDEEATPWRGASEDVESPKTTRRLSARVRQLPFYGTAGKITRVELRDFLNHRHLTWTPGSHCNVVTGMNGSGKSALARAILFCCGAESCGSSAGAGGDRVKLFEFIRQYWAEDGPRMAEVKVTFSNYRGASEAADAPRELSAVLQMKRELLQSCDDSPNSSPAADAAVGARGAEGAGSRAFHPEVWGSTLTIIRRVWKKPVSARGGEGENEQWTTDRSAFFLSAGRGGSVSGMQPVKKEKVLRVLESFGLDFANPAVFLTQDKSKTLLVASKEEDLYSFFTQVTGLEEASLQLRALAGKLYETETEIAKYTSSLGSFLDQVEVWKRAEAEVTHLKKQETSLARLKGLLPLLELRERRGEVEEVRKKVKRLEQEVEAAREKEQAAAEQCAALGGRRTMEQKRRQQEELERISQELLARQREQRDLRLDVKRLEREIVGKANAKKHEEELQTQVEERLRTAEETSAARRAQFAAADEKESSADFDRHLALVEDRRKQLEEAVAVHAAHRA